MQEGKKRRGRRGKEIIKKESRSAKRKPKREKLYENCKIIDNDLLSFI